MAAAPASAPSAPAAGQPDPLPLPAGPVPSQSTSAGPRRTLSLSRSLSPSSRSRAILSPNTGKPCLVCFDRERDGVECDLGAHFICRACLQGFIQHLEPAQIRRSGGCISCPGVGPDGEAPCDAAPWGYEDLAELLDAKTQKIYVSRLQGLLTSILSSASLQQQPSMHHHPYQRRRSSQGMATTQRWSLGRTGTRGLSLAASSVGAASLAPEEEASEVAAGSLLELQLEEELRWHRQRIDEEILTLTCPREGCHRAFLDFDGCFALTCPGCGCGFCAACLLDCGEDAHEHCRAVHHGYFGTLEAFNAAHSVRRLGAVAAYLRSLLLPPSPASSPPPSGGGEDAPASPVFGPPRPAASPEQAAAVVEALLTGPLAKDLAEVGIAVEEVRRALAGTKSAAAGGSAATAMATKLFGSEPVPADAAAPPEVVVPPIRLHYSQEAAQRNLRRLLDGPGYPPADDALAQWMGTCLTWSSMVAGVWWLTSGSSPAGTAAGGDGAVPLVLAALVVGPAGVLLGTGRGKQVVQALYVTLLAALLCIPLYFWGWQLFAWGMIAFVRILGVATHALGFVLDATMEGLRILRAVASGGCERRMIDMTARALDVIGLLPPDESLPTATA